MRKYILVAVLFAMASVAFSQWVPAVETNVVYDKVIKLDSANISGATDSLYIKLPTQSFVCDSVAYILTITENVDGLSKTSAVAITNADSVLKWNGIGKDSIGAIFKVQFHTPDKYLDSTSWFTWVTVLTKPPTQSGTIWGSNIRGSIPWPKNFGYIQGYVYNKALKRNRVLNVVLTQVKLTWRKV